jgi:two-component system response regulator YesN
MYHTAINPIISKEAAKMYKAIIVDDDQWTLVDMKACFSFDKFGFTIISESTSAEAAFPLIVQHRPDLVITDIRMESGSGLDLIRKCREKNIQSIFVILSGYDRFDYAQEAIKLGAFYYMLKPICDNEAHGVMQKVLLQLSDNEQGKDLLSSVSDSDDTFQAMLSYLEAHSDELITLDDLSQTFFLNRTYICDLFRKRTGKTFKRYLNDIRIYRACTLLKRSSLPVVSIAQRVGFDDAHYFARVFKEIMKIRPGEYRIRNMCK